MGNLLGKEEEIDYEGEVDLNWFNLLRCVGKGAFGKVRIVERRDTKQIYALKYINKYQCIKMKAVHNILRERALLEELQHPFLVNLRYAFQDDENMFMVIDLMMGGDLRFHLDRTGGFTEAQLRFYAAEISLVLAYMHKRRIVHRDLKPDNLLLDERGHCHITDFNIAAQFDESKLLKSHSGTLAYMAPEVFESNGYTYTVDWWSLGASLYECLYGRRPFHGVTNEELTNNIRTKTLEFPTHNLVTKKSLNVSKDCISFVQGLLERDIRKRMGCTTGRGNLDDVTTHPWFSGIDFDRLGKKEYTAPFIPDANHSNFDAMHDLEELLLEENPLTHRPRKKKPEQKPGENGTNSTSPASPTTPDGSPTDESTNQETVEKKKKSRTEQELEFIDTNFAVFDYHKSERYKDEVAAEQLAAAAKVNQSHEGSRRASKGSKSSKSSPASVVAPATLAALPLPPLPSDLYEGPPGSTPTGPQVPANVSVGVGFRRLGRDSEFHAVESEISQPVRSVSLSDRGQKLRKESEKPRAKSAAAVHPQIACGAGQPSSSENRKKSIFGGVRLFKKSNKDRAKESDPTTVVSSRPVMGTLSPDM
ncbi:hypothetical protein HDU93_004692 [Gonapodya sp. JEL0774]|nr:hypothetical protein HDU93_004692 [Gonapodya sp. JEL0774]